MTASEERQKVATVLIPEVQFNERRAKAFASVHEQMASGKPLKDEHGKPVQLDLSQAEILPGSFSFSTFDATLQGQSHLDRDLIDALHSFYRLLRQAERFREAAATDRAPPRRARFLQDYFSSAADAAKVAREKELMRRLEITAK
jgi:hypothetical protein